MRNFLLTFLLSFMFFSGTLLANENGEKNRVVIGFILATEKEERYKKDKAFFLDEAKKLGVKVIFRSASNDVSKQKEIMRELSNLVDVMVIQPVDSSSLSGDVEYVRAKGVPVVAYDRLIYDADINFYVAHDSFMVGIIQAKEAVKFTGGKGKFVILAGGRKHSVAKQITAGNLLVIDKYPKIKLIGVFYHENWDEKEAYITMKKVLSKVKDVSAVLANNSAMIRGAIRAMEERGIDLSRVFTAGADADLENCRLIVQGKQNIDILKDIEPLARSAVRVAFALATGKKVKVHKKINNGKYDVNAYLIPVKLVTAENMYDVIIKPGFHKKEDIYR